MWVLYFGKWSNSLEYLYSVDENLPDLALWDVLFRPKFRDQRYRRPIRYASWGLIWQEIGQKRLFQGLSAFSALFANGDYAQMRVQGTTLPQNFHLLSLPRLRMVPQDKR